MENNLANFKAIHLTIRVIIVGIRVFGNCLSFLVFCRKKFRKTTMAFYMRALAIIESYILFTLIDDTYYLIFKQQLNVNSLVYCKIFYGYAIAVSSSIQPWILMIMAVEKMLDIKIYQNSKLKKLKKSMKAPMFKFISTTLIILLSLLQFLYMPILITIKPIAVSNRNILTNNTISDELICNAANLPIAWYILGLVTYAIEGMTLPAIVLIGTSTIIVRTLYISRHHLESFMSFSQHRRVQDKKFAITSVTLNVFFLVLKLPLVFAGLINYLPTIDMYIKNDLILEVSISIFLTYSCLMFFINFITNSLFRRELMRMVKMLRSLGGIDSVVVQSPVITIKPIRRT
jgi:hypothetical protein